MAKKRRAKTRRQQQIRRKQQLQKQAAERREREPERPLRSEQRKARRDAQKVGSGDPARGLMWRFALALVVMLYGLAVWAVRFGASGTVDDNPGLWIGLLVGLGIGVAGCMAAGLTVTVPRRQWRWAVAIAVPVLSVPALYAYCYFTLKALRKGPGRPARTQTAATSKRPSDDIKLLGDR